MNLALSVQGVALVKSAQVVAVLGSCVVYARRKCCGDLVVSVQGDDLVLSV